MCQLHAELGFPLTYCFKSRATHCPIQVEMIQYQDKIWLIIFDLIDGQSLSTISELLAIPKSDKEYSGVEVKTFLSIFSGTKLIKTCYSKEVCPSSINFNTA